MNDLEIIKLEENTRYILNNFGAWDWELRYNEDYIIYAIMENLHQSIGILESKDEFSEKVLLKNMFANIAPEGWDDLFYLKCYENKIKELQNIIDSEQIIFDNEDDRLIQGKLENQLDKKKSELFDFETLVELTNEFRDLLLAIPNLKNLEIDFEEKQKEYRVQQLDKIECKNLSMPTDKKELTNNSGDKQKHGYSIIDEKKYDAKKIFETFNNVVFRCSEECFNAWFIDGVLHKKTIEFILQGRTNYKTKKPTLKYAQLRKFIEKITGDAKNTKDAYYKTVFGLEIKTAQYLTATNLDPTFKDLKNCEIKK